MKRFNHIIVIFLFTGSILFPVNLFSQLKDYRFEELESLQKTEQRNTVIFIHTDWCSYCKAMENATFKNEKVIEILNKDFYFAKLNAEEKGNILFAGKIFRYKPTGTNIGFHELATELGTINKQLSYPAIIILNPKNEIIFQYGGFIGAPRLISILKKFISH